MTHPEFTPSDDGQLDPEDQLRIANQAAPIIDRVKVFLAAADQAIDLSDLLGSGTTAEWGSSVEPASYDPETGELYITATLRLRLCQGKDMLRKLFPDLGEGT